MTTYTVTATATDATTDRITVSSATNMFSGLPIVFSGSVFGGITAGATYYIGTVVPGSPTSTITVTSLPGGAIFALSTAAGSMTGTFNSGGQQIIDIGAAPDDGTGDPLRTAFNDTNVNFDQVFAAGPVGSNVQIANNVIKTINTNGNLVLAPNGTGVVQSNVTIVPNTANVRNLGSAAQRWSTIYTQYLDISGTLTTGDLTVDGNLTVQGNIIQVGNIVTETLTIQLANAASTANAANGAGITVGANDNIATLLYGSTSNTWTTNIGLSSVGNITAPYFFGNGSQLTGLPAIYGNANVVANLAALGSNPVSTTGNITGGFIFGNISQANGFPATYGNANVVANLAALGSNPVSTTGNITGGFIFGNISQANGFPATYGNANVTALLGNLGSNVISGTGNIVSNNITIIGTTQTINARETLTLAAGGQFNICTILTGGSGYDTGSALKATTGGSGSGMTVGIGYGLSNQLTNADVVDPGTGYVDGDVITVSGGTGGTFVITRYNEQANQANNNFIESNWVFGNAGNLTLPGNTFAVNYANGTQVSIGGGGNTGNVTFNNNIVIGTGDEFGGDGLYLATGPNGVANLQYLQVRGGDAPTHIHLDTGNNAFYDQYFGNDNKFVKLEAGDAGNVVVGTDDNGNSYNWNFGTDGTLTLPGNTIAINYLNGNLAFGTVTFNNEAVIGTGTSNTVSGLYLAPDPVSLANDLYLRVRGNIQDEPTHIHFDTGNNQYYNQFIGDDNKYIQLANTGNIVINSNDAVGNSAQWTFDTTGNLTLPISGNVIVSGAIVGSGASPAPSLSGFSSVSAITVTATGNISAVGNIISGNLTVGSGTVNGGNFNGANFNGNVAFGTGTVGGSGNITGGNISAIGNISGGNVSTTGNITAANFFGNGSTLSNVATRFESAWTVPVGNSTQSFTVSPNETYYMWVDCNIPNGLLAWNATGTVTNTNVPVVGAQYAWVYSGGGTPIDFTSIPNQFVGTANTIVRSSVAPSATTNRFDFGLNNTSNVTVTVRYGWVAIS